MIIYLIIFLLSLTIVAGAWTIHWQREQLHYLKNKADEFYHDINSSLVITKLTIESLKNWTNHHSQSEYDNLINILQESVGQTELSFRHWDSSIK